MMIFKALIAVIVYFYIALFAVAFLKHKILFCFKNIIFVLMSPVMFYHNTKNVVQRFKKEQQERGIIFPRKVRKSLFRQLIMKTFHIFIPIYFSTIKKIENRESERYMSFYKEDKGKLIKIPSFTKEIESQISAA